MAEQHVIVWDLETIPDLAAAARMLDMVGGAGREGPRRQPPCDRWRADALGAIHIGERSEAELIGAFLARIGELHPQLR